MTRSDLTRNPDARTDAPRVVTVHDVQHHLPPEVRGLLRRGRSPGGGAPAAILRRAPLALGDEALVEIGAGGDRLDGGPEPA